MGEQPEGAFSENYYLQITNVWYQHFSCAVKQLMDGDKIMCLRGFVMGTVYYARPTRKMGHKIVLYYYFRNAPLSQNDTIQKSCSIKL